MFTLKPSHTPNSATDYAELDSFEKLFCSDFYNQFLSNKICMLHVYICGSVLSFALKIGVYGILLRVGVGYAIAALLLLKKIARY